MKLKTALDRLRSELQNDGELYDVYKSNIAMAYVDENRRQGSRDSYQTVHKMAHKAAENFLNNFIKWN